MIRRVAYMKAVLGGVLGAVGWEIVARIAVSAGLNVFDIVRTLGTLVLGNDSSPLAWWITGIALHATVGAIWAVFYAYFFWSTLARQPWLQGMLFSALPAILAGFVMVPQLDVMREAASKDAFGIFAWHLGWTGPAMLIVGHLIFGLVLGAMYIHPVGYRVGELVKINV